MARIRTIKPEFWQNERLSTLPLEAHFLAAALLNYADDFGYFNAHPGLIRAACVTLREDFQNIPELLRSLQSVDYIRLGTGSDGRLYGWIVGFSEHQKVSHPATSKIAGIVEFPEPASNSMEPLRNPPEKLQSPPEALRPEGNGMEQGRESILRSAPAALDGFDRFYSAYPKRKSRGDAEKAWKALQPDTELQALIAAAIEKAKDCDEWRKDGGKFIPYPASWLRAKGWQDEFCPRLPLMDQPQDEYRGLTADEIEQAKELKALMEARRAARDQSA